METTKGRMIGQDFFDLRSRIGSTLFSLAKLAPEAGAEPDHAAMLESVVNTLKDPFVFVVVGEVNVGKSTFLNALFGSDITKTGVVPTTDKILFFKHGPTLRHVPITRTLQEVFVPVDFLRDFHIVDTPGTNSIENEHQEITERFVPMADLVIFVFSAMNPWGASAWQFLEKVHRHWMRHVVFVLQQCDLRTDEEVAAIVDYMRQLCRQRFEREFPIFPVSAKKAYLARSGGLDRDRLMAESGFTALEAHISRAIGSTGQRLGKLTSALRTAGGVLSTVTARSGEKMAARDEKLRILREVEYELMQAEDRTNTKLATTVEATEADFTKEAERTMGRVRRSLGAGAALGSVFRDKRMPEFLERSLFDHLHASCLERWSLAAMIIEDDVCAAADHLNERLSMDLKVQMRDELRPDPSFWEAQRHRFVSRVEEMLQGTIHRLGLEKAIEPVLARTRRAAAVMLVLLLAACAGAAVLAWQQQWVLAGVALAGGALCSLASMVVCIRALSRAKQEAEHKLVSAAPDLRSHLITHLRDEVRNLYDSFTRYLQPTREKLADQDARYTALRAQIHAIEQAFRGMDRELEALSTISAG